MMLFSIIAMLIAIFLCGFLCGVLTLGHLINKDIVGRKTLATSPPLSSPSVLDFEEVDTDKALKDFVEDFGKEAERRASERPSAIVSPVSDEDRNNEIV